MPFLLVGELDSPMRKVCEHGSGESGKILTMIEHTSTICPDFILHLDILKKNEPPKFSKQARNLQFWG